MHPQSVNWKKAERYILRNADAPVLTANHGFGMKSIRYLAEKYGGMMEYSAEGGLFTMQIMIPVK